MSAAPPPNFSWCEDNVLCASAFPETEHLQYLVDNNVTSLVSLTSERQVERKAIGEDELTVVTLPIQDFTPPTIEQVEEFILTVLDTKGKRQATCVHCAHGLGRTGTMLSCYFVQTQDMTPEEAITHVRNIRPGSVETTEQELLVHRFYSHLKAKKCNGN